MALIGLELIEGVFDRCILADSVLQLEDDKRQAVDESDYIRAAVMAVLDHGELVGHNEIVVCRIGEVDQAHLA